MLRDMMKGHTVIEYKWVVIARLAALGLIVLTGLELTYAVTVQDRPASAGNKVEIRVSRNAAELRNAAIKSAVLKWMRCNSDMPDETLSRIYDASVNSGNSDLVLAVCVVESNFNPTARSEKGALGLMGIMPRVWLDELKSKGIVTKRRDLYGIAKNITSGAYVLGRYVERTGSIEDALTGYVGGDTSYAQKVLRKLGEIYLVRRSAMSNAATALTLRRGEGGNA